MESSEFNFLLNDAQREVVADMINEIIVTNLGGSEYSDLELRLIELNRVQLQIREQRNSLGEVFQIKVPK